MSEARDWHAFAAWPPALAHVHDAREFVRDHLATRGLAWLTDDVVLVVSELATNAAVHGRSGFGISLEGGAAHLLVRVADGSTTPPVVGDPGPDDPHGRGLRVVRMLCDDWGVDASGNGGKSVWARFRWSEPRGDLLAEALTGP